MKNLDKTISGIFLLCLFFLSGIIAQPAPGENEFRLAAVNPRFTGVDSITSDAGRGITVAANPDLDNDGKPEIIITDYSKGGRVFVYEMVGNDQLEFVWASKKLSETNPGGGSTPRSVTVGDFDNNGKMEIIFPIGYFASDTTEFKNRGIYFYEWTGNDNDYGTEPIYKLSYEDIDSSFATVNTGRTENSIQCQDIDGDGFSELLFPPRAFSFSVAKLYIMQVTSGTFAGGDVVINNEYVYEDMVQDPAISPDGYVPAGSTIGDVDNDGKDEIVVAGWQNIGSGAALGFIEISGPDTYTPGSIVRLADYSGFTVKGKPVVANVNGSPEVFVNVSRSTSNERKVFVLDGIVADQFVTSANVYELFKGLGAWGVFAVGDQDNPTAGEGDGIDLYMTVGSRILDAEYKGTGSVTDSINYTIKKLYDLAAVYDSLGGLFNDLYCYPGMDLDNDGNRDFVAAYKGWGQDSLGVNLAKNGFHVYFFEWGDSTQSINLSNIITDINVKEFSIITPDDYRMAQNYPNPFNPSTTIKFELPLNKTISLKIYNSLGQEVRTLINNQAFSAGAHSAVWDSRDNNGQQVASGVYVYKLIFGNFSISKKMTLLR